MAAVAPGKGEGMQETSLAEQAETVGLMVFKIGLAGLPVGFLVGWANGAPIDGALEQWFTYSIAVSVAGAITGSLAGLLRDRPEGKDAEKSAAPTLQPVEAPVPKAEAARVRPAISPFRAPPRRPVTTAR
ncbi:MAG: hypothetical protein DI533_01300 [Cereibacter sphaeroides]|uniref:Uncharacterized protein n=1 Tax=Cereibacter sphaeroides TaxID=1063 RepID=A0A2W5U7D8_CERSP|nr:MAG: hypothetical protein DI533_01300 [Cereibacter sphaeroides]